MPSSKRIKFLTTMLVIVLLALVIILDTKRRDAEIKLKRMAVQMDRSVSEEGQRKQRNEVLAKQVIQKVKRHIVIPDDVEPTVATIIDVAKLRSQNSFYDVAENGDHLLVTPKRAILYDSDRDIILDIAPVQIRQRSAEQVQ